MVPYRNIAYNPEVRGSIPNGHMKNKHPLCKEALFFD